MNAEIRESGLQEGKEVTVSGDELEVVPENTVVGVDEVGTLLTQT